MGIAGAALYSLVLMAVRELRELGLRARHLLRSCGHEFFAGGALYGASFYEMPHAPRQPKSYKLTNGEPQ